MTTSINNAFALDAQALNSLKRSAREAPDKSLKQAATQFEAVFMNMMLKSMRDTVAQDGAFDSEASRTYTSMLDQQLAQSLSGTGKEGAGGGIGLADMIVKQLQRNYSATAASALSRDGKAGKDGKAV